MRTQQVYTIKTQTIKKIVLIRNDKLGDFVLSFPSFSLIKQAFPDTEVVALVPSYTKQLAEEYAAIDRVIIEPPQSASCFKKLKFLSNFRREKFDISITLFSSLQTGFLLYLSGIRRRYAPATKIAQIFHSRRLRQKRSLSQKPEFEYNLDLVKFCLSDCEIKTPKLQPPPYLVFDNADIDKIRKNFFSKFKLEQNQPLIFLHPGSGGSANNLSLEQYSELASLLNSHYNAIIIITAGPGEANIAHKLSSLLGTTPHRVFESDKGLIDFSKHIMLASFFISGSTGPLHIAGALNIPTIGFYPKHRSATPLRWQTLNSIDKRLAFTPPPENDNKDMSAISMKKVAQNVADKFSHIL